VASFILPVPFSAHQKKKNRGKKKKGTKKNKGERE
jgi:hypothetical protein